MIGYISKRLSKCCQAEVRYEELGPSFSNKGYRTLDQTFGWRCTVCGKACKVDYVKDDE